LRQGTKRRKRKKDNAHILLKSIMKLQNKVAIVTGAGAGMGKAVALRYAQEGARVVLVEYDEVSGKAAAQEIQSSGGECLFIRTNVADEDEVSAMIQKTVDTYGRIDVLYNNVARMSRLDRRVHEVTTALWNELVAVNFTSAFYCAKYVITEMLKTGGGSLIFVGSPTALVACATNDAAYSSTKAGVHSLARVIAGGYGADNIRSNIVIPGTMQTPMTEAILADSSVREHLQQSAMLRRLGTSDDVCGLAVFLASDESSYCTGAYFTVDGGLTAL
jgi:NAD(P)-dependent dehydrogenase (short-subunit alcohol dehydrogenase family)